MLAILHKQTLFVFLNHDMLLQGRGFNPFPHNDTFWETSLLKTLWEKEKLLVKSNFSFLHSVFYLFV